MVRLKKFTLKKKNINLPKLRKCYCNFTNISNEIPYAILIVGKIIGGGNVNALH